MRRFLPFLALLLWCVPAHAAITYVGGCTPNASTSCTLSITPQYGDVLISSAYRNSATAATTATGYTVIKSTTGSTNSIKVGWKYALGTETTCGTWANATATDCRVYRGVANRSAGPVGTTTGGTTGASTTISYSGFTLTVTNGTSWVGCDGGAGSATAGFDTAPTGMTLRSGSTLATLASSDTNGAVSTWTTQTVTFTTSSNWASACYEILAAPANSSVASNVYQHHYSAVSGEANTTPFTFTVNLPQASGSNNLMRLVFAWSYASVAPTVSSIACNSGGGTFVSGGHNVLDTGNLTDVFLYYVAGATSGCTQIVVTASSAWSNAWWDYTEFYGVATSSPLDTAAGAGSLTAPQLSAGSITPGTSGDIIDVSCTTEQQFPGFATSTGIWGEAGAQLIDPDTSFGVGGELFIQTTAAAITPYITIAGSTAGSECVEAAWKVSGGSGTAPSGMHVISQSTFTINAQATIHVTATVFGSGHTLLVMAGSLDSGGTLVGCSGISDILGNSFTAKQNSGGSSNVPSFWFDNNANAGQDYITLTGCAAAGNSTLVVDELSGFLNSSHTAAFDSTMGLCTNTGGAAPYSSAPSCTPAGSNELIIAQMQEGTGPATAITSPSCGNYAFSTYSGQTDISFMTEGQGLSYCFNPSGTESWTWTVGASSAWQASAIAFVAASSAVVRHRAWVTQ